MSGEPDRVEKLTADLLTSKSDEAWLLAALRAGVPTGHFIASPGFQPRVRMARKDRSPIGTIHAGWRNE